MNFSRRELLGAGGLMLTASLAGCGCCGPSRFTEIEVEIDQPFYVSDSQDETATTSPPEDETDAPSPTRTEASESPIEVQMAVEVTLQNLGSRGVGLDGVELHALDADREPIGSRWLGVFTYRNADPDRREVEELEESSVCNEVDIYRATHAVDVVLETDGVPDLITVSVQRVWFDERAGDHDGEPPSGTMRSGVGVARAMSCFVPPELTVIAQQYDGPRPPSGYVEPSDYEHVGIPADRFYRYEGGPVRPVTPTQMLAPSATQNETASPTNETASPTNETTSPTNETATDESDRN